MSSGTFITLAGLLGGVFFFVVAAMVWQEARRRSFESEPVYVVEDAVDHIMNALAGERRLGRSDVLRIVEWEIFYLRGLAQSNRREPVETIAGGATAAVDYIADQILSKHGVAYAREDIAAVLTAEADYLESIGAVGERVDETER